MTYHISNDCIGCGACAKKCPEAAIEGEVKVRFDIDPYLCQECGVCFETCRQGAVIDPEGNASPRKTKKNVKAHIDSKLCAGCQTCALNCPQDTIQVIKRGIFSNVYCRVDPENCTGCGTCTQYCITGAVELG